ncbi:hypothetical protein [Vibrio diabolicus]|uniref:hypothetical protein n=1 Tax=Vibrio diabolicus TaxID=50719 RepID=UPI00211AAD6B|nr:hypothetical protein [Vibrio diabolicus]MCG6237751.1 hypothetical protein [Vibrio diabolicus]
MRFRNDALGQYLFEYLYARRESLMPLLPEDSEFVPEKLKISLPVITLDWQNEESWKEAFDFYQLRLNQIYPIVKPLLLQALNAYEN